MADVVEEDVTKHDTHLQGSYVLGGVSAVSVCRHDAAQNFREHAGLDAR